MTVAKAEVGENRAKLSLLSGFPKFDGTGIFHELDLNSQKRLKDLRVIALLYMPFIGLNILSVLLHGFNRGQILLH